MKRRTKKIIIVTEAIGLGVILWGACYLKPHQEVTVPFEPIGVEGAQEKPANTEETVVFVPDEEPAEDGTIGTSAVPLSMVELFYDEEFYEDVERPLQRDPQHRSIRQIAEAIADIIPISPELIEAVAIQETNCRDDVASQSGKGVGPWQVHAEWHYDRMEKYGITDLWDPYSNGLVAADYLYSLFEEAAAKEDIGDDVYYVLMRYNMSIKTAEHDFSSRNYSDYAKRVTQYASDLSIIHERETYESE